MASKKAPKKKEVNKKFVDDGEGVIMYDEKGKKIPASKFKTKAGPKKKSSIQQVAAGLSREAAVSQDKLREIFDKLKKGMTVEVSWKGGMSSAGKHERKVGRRSFSKKYGVTSITLDRADGQKSGPMSKVKLMKRDRSGNVSLALGDMGVTIEHLSIK